MRLLLPKLPIWVWKVRVHSQPNNHIDITILGPLHTRVKGHDHVIVRALDPHSKVVPTIWLTWSAIIYVMPISLRRAGTNSSRPWDFLSIVCHVKIHVDLFIHGNFSRPLDLHLLVLNELRQPWFFQPNEKSLNAMVLGLQSHMWSGPYTVQKKKKKKNQKKKLLLLQIPGIISWILSVEYDSTFNTKTHWW